MSPPFHKNPTPRLVIEHVYTRDEKVPLYEGDHEFDLGWRCIPVPPDPDGWVIFDSSRDKATGWRRIRLDDGGGTS